MAKKRKKSRQVGDDIMAGMAELDGYIRQGMTLDKITQHIKQHHPERVRVIFVPQKPGKYPPAAVRKLRIALDMSQATFAESVGVSCILVQSWERGVRAPSRLACRLLDIISKQPAAWVASLRPTAVRPSRRAS